MGKSDLEVLQARIAEGEEKERKEKLKKMKKEMKAKREGFFKDFKKFITRGNVVDMAVGVIVGGAFTAIVNALSNNILKPLINYLLAALLGKDSLSEVFTFLTKVTDPETGEVLLAESIYIDWGTFINAIINFLLVAFTLFVIARIATGVMKRVKARELAAAAEAAEKQKAEEAVKAAAAAEAAAKAAEAAAAEAAAKEAALQSFYANVARQTELLEQLAKK